MLLTKNIYEPASRSDGMRVLVMRLWPRGVKKNRVSLWLKELGPVYPLLKEFKSGRMKWPEYRRRYKAGLKAPLAQVQLKELKKLQKRRRVTVLCSCRDAAQCHRTLLKQRLNR